LLGAFRGGHLDIVKYAESKGEDEDIDWNYAFSDASYTGHLDIVKSYSA